MSLPDEILDGIDRLEPLPITVQKLVVALQDEDVDFNEIAEVIEFDGAITSNILRTANSAAFGGRSRIAHVRDAVVRLGTVTMLDIMLIGHLKTMRVPAPCYHLSEDDLWLHGATASLAVKAVRKETRNRKIPEASTIAALIHDIGKLILVRYIPAENPTALESLQQESLSLVEAERRLFGCDHAEVGGAMARKWSFPDDITRAIEGHHEIDPEAPTPMLDVVIVANLTSNLLRIDPEVAGNRLPSDAPDSRRRIGLSREGFEQVCLQTSLWMQDLRDSYGMA